jgi:hypothetical protein
MYGKLGGHFPGSRAAAIRQHLVMSNISDFWPKISGLMTERKLCGSLLTEDLPDPVARGPASMSNNEENQMIRGVYLAVNQMYGGPGADRCSDDVFDGA